jgi:4-hydroxy-tetrahydrodipicolinate synthase
MFEGLTVAMVTPFREGRLDTSAVDRLLDYLLEGGVDGIVPSGTTGEGPTLTAEERRELFRQVRRRTAGKAHLLAGTGTNNTEATILQTRMALEEGADGALIVTPYYNKPSQAGLRAHFARVAEAVRIPICVYNVPGRTGVSIAPATLRELAEIPSIVAIKEASGSLDQASEICRDTRLTVLSGDDSLTLPMMAVGAKGVISVLGNIVPAPFREMLRAASQQEAEKARSLHLRLFSLMRALFVESNPGPIKHALARCGMIEEEYRLPLVPVSPASARVVDEALDALPREWLPGRP